MKKNKMLKYKMKVQKQLILNQEEFVEKRECQYFLMIMIWT